MNKKILKSKKSQILIISIFAFVLIFMLAFMVVEVGNLIYWKIHIQNIADSAAMEGGTWYARALNIVSLSNKVLFLVASGGLILSVLTLGTTAGSTKEAIEVVQKVQDVFAGTGSFKDLRIMPALNAGAVFINGIRNENTLCVPVFNVADFEIKDALPSFNLKRRMLSDFLDFDDNEANDKYYYRKKTTGEKVYVDEKNTRKNKIGWTIEKKTGKRLIKEGKISLPAELSKSLKPLKELVKNFDLPFDIVETGEHTILVIALKKNIKPLLDSKFFKKKNSTEDIMPSMLIASSMVVIDGGKMDFWDLDGASYTPELRHIILPKINIKDKDNQIESGLTNFSEEVNFDVASETGINNIFSFLSKATQFLSDNILLH